MSKPTETRSYRQLRRTVASLLEEGRERARQAVERERAITYWRVGEVIHTHALGAARRAPFGDGAMKRLAKDVGVPQQRLYEALKFYRCFPIFRTSGKLTWSHYLGLLKLPSEEARRYYEQAAIDGCWSVKELVEKIEDRTYARHLEPVATVPDSAKPLVAQRGEIGLYRVKQPPGQKRSGLFLDLGFGHFWSLSVQPSASRRSLGIDSRKEIWCAHVSDRMGRGRSLGRRMRRRVACSRMSCRSRASWMGTR